MAFPEPVFYASAAKISGWTVSRWDSVEKLLSYLKADTNNFISFELPEGSYVQCLGGKRALTVEIRIVSPTGAFTHLIAGRGSLHHVRVQVGGAAGIVTVDRSQVLQMRHARVIFRQFIEQRTLPLQFEYQDVSDKYEPNPYAHLGGVKYPNSYGAYLGREEKKRIAR